VFPLCHFKCNNVEEIEFLKHLKEEHSDELLKISKKENMSIKAVEISDELLKISKKENMSIKAVEMITTSNSSVFINSN